MSVAKIENVGVRVEEEEEEERRRRKMKSIVVLAGSSHPEMARTIAQRLGVELCKVCILYSFFILLLFYIDKYFRILFNVHSEK